jgi:thiosulfate/3-mercaptopyruvate sulfurtransferase
MLEPEALERRLADATLHLVDLSRAEQYARGHIPGAVHLDYSRLLLARPPVMGLLPSANYISALFSSLSLTNQAYIVAYDDEGGGHAARLLWTLAAYGHTCFGLLNGGLHAWANEGHPLDSTPVAPGSSKYAARYNPEVVADREYILARLGNSDTRLLDCRSSREYVGDDKRAARAGHIPGAVNMDWVKAIDQTRNLRLRDRETLMRRLAAANITPDREVITYCQTHHRSAHTWLTLKVLGFPQVRGYPGSWSEWGNLPDTPIE